MKSRSWCSPGELVALMLAGWVNRHQQAVITYQREEIRALREMLGGNVCGSPMNNVAASH